MRCLRRRVGHVRPLGAVFVVAALVAGAGAQARLDAQPDPATDLGQLLQHAYLKAHLRDGADQFGTSIAVSGDTMVVGAVGEDGSARGVNGTADNGAPESGAVYVFVRTGGTWSLQAYLKALNSGAGDWFGRSVAIDRDIIVVGAYGEASRDNGVNAPDHADNSAPNAGAAYVFRRVGATWVQEAYLKASNSDADDFFGWSVAVAGNVIVVGAWGEDSESRSPNRNSGDNSSPMAGAAYVFRETGGAWQQVSYLKASNTEGPFNPRCPSCHNDAFGWTVAITADASILVGAPGEDGDGAGDPDNNRAFEAGAVYHFRPSGSGFAERDYLKAPAVATRQRFGVSIAASAETLAVRDDRHGIHVLERSGSGWRHKTTLTVADTWGTLNGLAAAGGLIAVGAPSEGGAGAVHVFELFEGRWRQHSRLVPQVLDAGDAFGAAVGIDGQTVAVGAPRESSLTTSPTENGAANVGAAYVFGVGPAPTVAPPGAPVLQARVSGAGLTLEWVPGPGGTPASYELQVASDQSFTRLLGHVTLGLATTHTLSLPTGFGGWARVLATNAGGTGVSNVLSIGASSPCTRPAVPADVRATRTGASATVSWTAVVGASSYRVEADVSGARNVVNVNVGAVTAVSGRSLAAGAYTVRVYAVNACGESAPGSVAFVM